MTTTEENLLHMKAAPPHSAVEAAIDFLGGVAGKVWFSIFIFSYGQ